MVKAKNTLAQKKAIKEYNTKGKTANEKLFALISIVGKDAVSLAAYNMCEVLSRKNLEAFLKLSKAGSYRIIYAYIIEKAGKRSLAIRIFIETLRDKLRRK